MMSNDIINHLNETFYSKTEDKTRNDQSLMYNNDAKKKNVTLTWSDLSVYVKQRHPRWFGSTRISYKKIVNNGAVLPGKLIALMGPSGSGKSTILQALANRCSGNMMVDGDVRINGRSVTSSMVHLSGLMRQEDLFIGVLTVREHLNFMARLKLDRRTSAKERERRVSTLLESLSLSHCSNRRIGGSTLGGTTELSGGERKRLSLATTCLPEPPLLFCDEPTTGLDSHSALRILTMMSGWQASSILCTIHQPSPELLAYFSSVILVADGSLVFSGTSDDAVQFFQQVGYSMSQQMTVGDFLVSCLSPTPGSEAATSFAVKKLAHHFALSENAKTDETVILLQKHLSLERMEGDMENCSFDFKPSFWIFKFIWLFYRGILEVLRNPNLQWVKILEKILIAVTAGLCYVGAVRLDQLGVQAVQGALFVLITENTFPPMYAALDHFQADLPLTLREIRDGDYHPSAVYLAKIMAKLPGLALEAWLFTTIVYWLASLRDTLYAYAMITFCTILCINVSVACGTMFSNAFESAAKSSIFLIPFDNAVMITSGTFIRLSTLPLVVNWVQYISWLKHSYESMTIVQWQDVQNLDCSASTYLPCLRSGEEILEHYSFDEDNLYRNIISLVFLYLLFHTLGYLFFVRKIKKS